jgi:putative heme-binding domain-containing protein
MLAGPLAAQHQNPPQTAAAESGARSFRTHCSSCHGRNAQGGRAPDLTVTTHDDAELARIVAQGIPGTPMEAYGAKLSASEIARIVVFIRAANRDATQITGNAARGETLFWSKGKCGSCHGVRAQGNRIGPDLSQIGGQRSIPSLRESLVSPAAVIAPGFTTVAVVTKEGKAFRGIERVFDDFNVILLDDSGAVRSFDRAQLRSAERESGSLMPDARTALSQSELEDVLAYLWSLKPTREGVETR